MHHFLIILYISFCSPAVIISGLLMGMVGPLCKVVCARPQGFPAPGVALCPQTHAGVFTPPLLTSVPGSGMWYPGQAEKNNCLCVRSQCSPCHQGLLGFPLRWFLGKIHFLSFSRAPGLLDSLNKGKQSQLCNDQGGLSLPRILRTAENDLNRPLLVWLPTCAG